MLLFGVVVAGYVVAGRLGFEVFALPGSNVSPVWPAAGVALAALLLGGLRLAPAVYLGSVLTGLLGNPNPNLLGILIVGGGNTLEAVVGAVLIQRFAGGRHCFRSARGVFLFALRAADAALVSATVGTTTRLALGTLELGAAPGVMATWWLGNAVGAILVAPAIILLALDRSVGALRQRWPEATLLGVCILALGVLMLLLTSFGEMFGMQGTQLRFLALPIILWVAFRFGPRETAVGSIVIAAVALGVALTAGAPPWSIVFLQAFLGVSALTGLAVAAVVAERHAALESLRQARDELELRVAVRTAALETALDDLARSNKDLQEFAYVASHDLQEPLRAVAGYTQLLQRRHGAALDDDARSLISRAVDGALRMQSLINDLLSFSRVGTHGQPLRPVDLLHPLEVALKNLEAPLRESGAKVTVDPLPRVVADDSQMVQLLQNLVGNAVKFRQPGKTPEVHIGAEPGANGMTTLFVRDNGIGIEPKHHQRVFVIFQRLHRAGEYPGSGIGLAVAKRIVERHGGRIWIDSQPGSGSTFRFTLRSAPKP